jgi:four helix bundle protein
VAAIRQFEDLEAWQKARVLTQAIYGVTKAGPFAHDFMLQDQIRGAAVSVMANLAEGFERGGNKEFLQFLAIAKGSCGEVRSHLCAALDQRYVTPEQFDQACQKALEVSRMVSGLMKHLRASAMRGAKYS